MTWLEILQAVLVWVGMLLLFAVTGALASSTGGQGVILGLALTGGGLFGAYRLARYLHNRTGFDWEELLRQVLGYVGTVIAGAFGGVALLGGLLLSGHQAIIYLQEGIWPEVPASYLLVEPRQDPTAADASFDQAIRARELAARVMEWIPEYLTNSLRKTLPWFGDPESWFGLHKIVMGTLGSLSLGGFLVVLGICLILIAVLFHQTFQLKDWTVT